MCNCPPLIVATSVCLARYKTRPGLTYHYNHSHKVAPGQGDMLLLLQERDAEGYQLPEGEQEQEPPEEGSPGTPPHRGEEGRGKKGAPLQAIGRTGG